MSDLHLVLLPGLDGTGKLFKPFIEQMESTDEITVVSYSTQVHKPFEALVDYVISLLPVNRPLVILGESFSGPVAIRIAARSHLNIQGLVLAATFAKYPVTLGVHYSSTFAAVSSADTGICGASLLLWGIYGREADRDPAGSDQG